MPRSGSSVFQHQLERDYNLINIKEFFSFNVRWSWYPGFGIFRHDHGICNLPNNFNKRLSILKNDPQIEIEDIVIKILSHQIEWPDDFIKTFKNEKIFILNRKDTYRQFLSWYVSNATKIYHQTPTEFYKPLDMNAEFPEKILVDKHEFTNFMNLFKQYVQGVSMFKTFFTDVTTVHYEDLEFDKDGDYKKFEVDYSKWFINTKEIKDFTHEVDQYKLMLFK